MEFVSSRAFCQMIKSSNFVAIVYIIVHSTTQPLSHPATLKKGKLFISHRYNQTPLLYSYPGGFNGSWSYKTCPNSLFQTDLILKSFVVSKCKDTNTFRHGQIFYHKILSFTPDESSINHKTPSPAGRNLVNLVDFC